MTYNVFSGTLNPTQSVIPVTNQQCQSTEGKLDHNVSLSRGAFCVYKKQCLESIFDLCIFY